MSLARQWLTKSAESLISIITFIVFLILDFLDTVFCVIFKYIDEYIEGEASTCYCENRRMCRESVKDEDDDELSETLYARKNVFREIDFLKTKKKSEDYKKKCDGGRRSMKRWSDCGCESCHSWVTDGDHKLHLVVKEPSIGTDERCKGEVSENVIFLHGFISSSSFWTQTVFPNFSEQVKQKYRMIAVDLLGFGRSPKPRDCSYTLKEHVRMIQKSVVQPLQLGSFHLVAHSMGCVIALALAAKYPNSVNSITLVAPPYFPSEGNDASLNALKKIAGKKLWPPLSFGSSFLAWDLHLLTKDLTRHTHQSAWSSMHNVICGGAKFMDNYLKILSEAGVRINVIHGDEDDVVPLECCCNLKMKAPVAEVSIVGNADHGTVIFGREKEFAHYLEVIWASCCSWWH